MRRLPIPILIVGLLSAACSSGPVDRVGKTVPVQGRLTVDGKTLPTGTISFWPDTDKGNTSEFQPTGDINGEGIYELMTHGKAGAPPGWYKVVVVARENVTQPGGRIEVPTGKSLINARYGDIKTTDLTVEVVENAATEAYHFKLQK